jgi:hypothetical protein
VTVISHHLLRRRARAKQRKLQALEDPKQPRYNYRVERAQRGPWRWRVVRSELGLRPE